jgi:hypothetical protein
MRWYQAATRHRAVHIEQRNHWQQLFGVIQEAVNVLDLEHRSAGPSREHRHATLETHIGIGYPPEQGFCELVDVLARLVRQISKSCLDLGIHGDGSRWHVDPSAQAPFLTIRSLNNSSHYTCQTNSSRSIIAGLQPAATIPKNGANVVESRSNL